MHNRHTREAGLAKAASEELFEHIDSAVRVLLWLTGHKSRLKTSFVLFRARRIGGINWRHSCRSVPKRLPFCASAFSSILLSRTFQILRLVLHLKHNVFSQQLAVHDILL